MPRNATGGYTLPAGNPVVTGTIIASGWANPTMADIQLALTDSLSRSGNGGMLAPFKVPDGSNINPSLSFVNEATSGLYRFGANDIRMAVGTTDRMRWQGAGTPPQIYDEGNDRWNDLGAGGVDWRHAPTIPAEVEQGVGYMTRGGQSTLMPASPITGQAVTFSDLDNDWSETNFLTLDGNGSTFTQGSQTTYDLDLKGAFAQFAYLDGQWQIVNFGRLSDAYGFDLDDYATLALVNSKPNENLLINGGFDVWQRGISGFSTNQYTADRWYLIGDWSCARTNFSPSKDGLNYASLLTCTTAGTFVLYHNKVEDLGRACRGQTVTFSLNAEYIRASAKIDCDLSFRVRTSVDGSSNSNFNLGTVALKKGNFDDNRIYFTATLPDFSAEAYNANSYAAFELVVNSSAVAGNTAVGDLLKLGAVKVEEGSVATPYQARPIGEEEALCRRYYTRVTRFELYRNSNNETNKSSVAKFPMRSNAAVSYGTLTGVTSLASFVHLNGDLRAETTNATVNLVSYLANVELDAEIY